MSGWSVVRWTGILGLAAMVLQVLAVIIFSAGGLPPAFDDANKVLAYLKNGHIAFTTSLILFFIGFALFIGFLAGFRSIATATAPDHEWLATTTLAAGIANTVIAFVSLGLILASTSIAASSHPDAAVVRTLYETSGVLGAAPALVPLAFYLGAAGSLVATTGILPRWLALVGWIGSVLALIASLSSYGGSDPAAFWSANGFVTFLALLPLYVWTVGASVVLLRQKDGVARLYG
jgi:hypothetical protein